MASIDLTIRNKKKEAKRYEAYLKKLPYILHSPDNTFDSFHTAPYSFLLIPFQQ